MHNSVYEIALRFWVMIECAVDKMTVPQTAAIGGSGSIASLVAATAEPDFSTYNAYLQTATLSIGLMGAVLSLGLIMLKATIEWRKRNDK